jgi:hypothetical protein
MAATQGLSEDIEDVKPMDLDTKSFEADKRWGQLISLNPQFKDIDLIGKLFEIKTKQKQNEQPYNKQANKQTSSITSPNIMSKICRS